tara:strand:+ start:23833 stop:24000 length:168 start_codon:yes stop_codon:yes gene_type:complete
MHRIVDIRVLAESAFESLTDRFSSKLNAHPSVFPGIGKFGSALFSQRSDLDDYSE